MLTLRLDELVTPKLVLAFQQQWASGPNASLAQARDALRILTTPGTDAERFIASIVLALVDRTRRLCLARGAGGGQV
ncbi:hypothetical protein AB5I41_15005 [Sphingomonas sp. MMS24-JH45]